VSKVWIFLSLLPPPLSLALRAMAMEHLLSQEVILLSLSSPATHLNQATAPLEVSIQMSAPISTTPRRLESLIAKFTCSLAQ
jgi:hypothetical protein